MKKVIGDSEPPVANIALERLEEPVELARIATLPPSLTALSIGDGQLRSL